MKKLVILAFDENRAHVYTVKDGTTEEYEELIEKLGHNINNCHWQILDSGNSIIIH